MNRLLYWIDKHAALIMITAAVIYFAYVGTLSILDHYGLRTQLSDLGHMEQSIWQVTQGDPAMTLSDPVLNTSRFAQHANVIFYIIAPLYAIFPSPLTLLLLGTPAVATAGVLLFYLARHILKNNLLALLFGAALLANPLVQETNLYDFHPEVLALPLFLATILFQEKRQWTGYWISIVLLMTVKEDMPLLAIAIGLYITVRSSRRQGLLTILSAISYWAVLQHAVSYLTNTPMNQFTWHRFEYLGDTPLETIVTLTKNPLIIPALLSQPAKAQYLLYIFLQGGFLVLLSPLAALWALPNLTQNILDYSGFQSRLTSVYYSGLVITAMYAAAIYGLRTIKRNCPRLTKSLLIFFVLQVIIVSIAMSPTPYGLLSSWQDFRINYNRQDFIDIISRLPPHASLATQNGPAAHLAARDIIVKYPSDTDAVDYILLHVHDPTNCFNDLFFADSPSVAFPSQTIKYEKTIISQAFSESDFGILTYIPPWYLFKRGQDKNLNDEAYQSALRDIHKYPPYQNRQQPKCNSVTRLKELYSK